MTQLEQVSNKYGYEIAGFVASAGGSTLNFHELFDRGVEVAIFAFITGLFGAAAAHLYRVVVTKVSKPK